jgi:hypothetical protein
MPYTAAEALTWVGNYIKKPTTDKYRQYAVLDLVSFMGVISSFSDDEWYKSYALLLYYNTLGRDKQNPIGTKYASPLKFSYDNGAASGSRNRNKDTKPTVDKNATLLGKKNVELHGCGQCAYFADRAGELLAIPQLNNKPAPPRVEKVALSNHNLVRVNGDAAAAQHVIVDLWWIALGHPVAKSICKLSDWGLKGQYDDEGGVTVKKTWNPDPAVKAWA